MTDIVERLRMKVVGAYLGHGTYEAVEPSPVATEAADEIERLRSLLKEAEKTLDLVTREYGDRNTMHFDIVPMARTVLSKIKGEA